MPEEKIQPELRDIMEMIYRYNATNKEAFFIFRFVGFKKDPTQKCTDCGDYCDVYDEESSALGAFGDKEMLRTMMNELRDAIEDEADEDGYVNI